MSINIPIPQLKDPALYPFFTELLRRAVDGTVVPVFVTTTATGPQLVVGGTSSKMGSGNGQLSVVTQAHFDQLVTFWNHVLVQRSIGISGDANIAGLTKTGALVVAGPVTVGSLTIPNGTITIGNRKLIVIDPNGQTSFDGDVFTRGNLIAQNNLAVSQDATVSRTLRAGSATIAGTLSVGGLPFVGDPWTVDVDVFMTPINHVNFASWAVDSTILYGGYNVNSGAQNDEVTYDLALTAGTWTLEVLSYTDTNRGAATIFFDGVNVGVIDQYSSPAVKNTRLTLTGIKIPKSGRTRMTFKILTKNGSSSNFFWVQSHIQLRRTSS